ncbi:MAG: phage protein GemA/Gp16 family protein [Bacteroidota bacterium]
MLDNLRIRAIHTLAKQAGLDDETYREMLATSYNVSSCKEMLAVDADSLIMSLKASVGQKATLRRVERQEMDQTQTEPGAPTESTYASKAMLRRLRFHQIRCGLHYVEERFLGHTVEEETGEIIMGEPLRAWLLHRFNTMQSHSFGHVVLPIPPQIMRRMYESWINPKSNEFLVEGGFKRYVLAPDRLFFQELPATQIDYLIQRFRAMHAVLDAQETKAQKSL